MRVTVNGQVRELAGPITLDALIEQLDLNAEGLAVLYNQQVVSHSQFAETALSEGDELELVRMVGGG